MAVTTTSPQMPDAVATQATPAEDLHPFSNDGWSDVDSAVEDLQSRYTQSLTPSVCDFPVEHGRRYHALRPGNYAMPNDEPELARLDLMHEIMTRTLGDRLFLTPIETQKVNRVLDLGTGTGIWAIDYAERFPNAEVLGNDLSPIQPRWLPSNVRFVVDDIEAPWVHRHKFDFIFSRYLTAAIKDWPTLVKSAYENLDPGGWVEFQDFDLEMYVDGDEYPEAKSATLEWDKLVLGAARRIGREPCPGPKLEDWVREVGFTNVTHRTFRIPVGGWPESPHLQEVGFLYLAQTLDGLEAFSLRLMCDVLEWKVEDVQKLLEKVRTELLSGRQRLYMNL
ncbi:hypothetical protein OQA88_8337 [Cercophora sp. LCS_1]